MNYGIIRKIIGKIMILMGLLMVLPLLVAIIYQENARNILSFTITIVLLCVIGYLIQFKKPKDNKMLAREGFIIVALSWLLMSLFGCIPFMVSGEIPNFFDAFFEMSSGFTTTGASILGADNTLKVEELSHSMLFWRSFSHWIGGMGVLVFIMAIIPESKEGSSMHIIRAESPGPQVGKLVSKTRATSRILYLIYIGITLIQFILLWAGPDRKMDLYHSIVYTLGTAGTGGFSVDSTGLQFYSAYSQYIIGIFMILYGINFTVYYLILIGNFKEVIKYEEVRWYLIIVIASILIIFINLLSVYQSVEYAFRLALFQVGSIVSTTGYSTIDFNLWPTISKTILMILMFFGACAGSTAGGIKTSRIIIMFKSTFRKIGHMINPRKVSVVKMDGKPIDDTMIEGVQSFFVMYFIILMGCTLLISIDNFDVLTNFSASLACISNIGPGFNIVGPIGTYGNFSNFSKLVLSLEMIAGRLELFPILILFSPKNWRRSI